MVLRTLGEGAMVRNEICTGYKHDSKDVQDRINQSKARNAPSHDKRYLVLQFQCMIAGKEEWKKQGDLGHKVKKDIDWDFVRKLDMVNRQLQVKGRHNIKHTADFL